MGAAADVLSRARRYGRSPTNGGMNPLHREAGRSAGLHLFQELSTLGQQLTRTLLLR
jgi:hypothetical protein